jgi:hypothetical protein
MVFVLLAVCTVLAARASYMWRACTRPFCPARHHPRGSPGGWAEGPGVTACSWPKEASMKVFGGSGFHGALGGTWTWG